MKETKIMYNAVCDCCGEHVDPDHYWDEQAAIDQMMHEEGWKTLGGKDLYRLLGLG